jgi:hypothetical protein
MMVLGLKTILAAIGFSACIFPRIVADPVINETAVLLRPKLLHRFQVEAN